MSPPNAEMTVPQTVNGLNAEISRLKLELKERTQRNSFEWIFHFVDIIYVATVYAIEQLFSQCGENPKVFLMAASYFGIMFSTRNHFDVYAFTFKVKKENEIPRIIVFIIYCLGVYNMTLNIAWDPSDSSSSDKGHYGTCERNVAYDEGFGGSYIGSRVAIMVLYLYHYFLPPHGSTNPIIPVAEYRKLMIKKFVPIVLCCIVMLFIFDRTVSPVVVFPLAALIEFCGDRIGDIFLSLPEILKPDAHHYQERLGLMFMLVLGETMVGLLFIHYNAHRPARTYATVIAGFFIVASVGMQFFERAQSDVHEHSATSKHPMYDRRVYGSYVWFHGFISFFMLIAANGVTEVYYSVAGEGSDTEEYLRLEYVKITGGLVCVWISMLILEMLQPRYRANLLAYLPHVPVFLGGSVETGMISIEQYEEVVGHVYCKFLFVVKMVVALLHLLLYSFGKHSSGNYFVCFTAVIASIPSLCDIMKQLYDFHVKQREKLRRSMAKNNLVVAHRDARIASVNQKRDNDVVLGVGALDAAVLSSSGHGSGGGDSTHGNSSHSHSHRSVGRGSELSNVTAGAHTNSSSNSSVHASAGKQQPQTSTVLRGEDVTNPVFESVEI